MNALLLTYVVALGPAPEAGSSETKEVQTEVEAPAELPKQEPSKPARKRGRFWVTWSMGQTVGDSYTFLDRFTVSGVDIGFEYRILPFFGAGISGGFIDFRQKFRRTVERENAALNATQLRLIGATSILANAMFHIPNRSIVEPYAGVGIGTYYTYRSVDIGWVYTEDNGWHFGLAPTVGVELHAPKVDVILGSRFNWAPEAGSTPAELYFTFNVGLGFGAF